MESKVKKPTQKAQLVPLTLKMRVSKSGPRATSNKPIAVLKPPIGTKKQLEYTLSLANIQKRQPD